jgi:hypothetical protein
MELCWLLLYRQGIPMSVVVRNAIVKYLKNEGIQIGEGEKEESKKIEAKPGLAIIPKSRGYISAYRAIAI